MSRFVFYLLLHDGTVTERLIGGQEYSYDLAQGGLQIPVKYSFEGPASIVKVLRTNVERLLEEYTVAYHVLSILYIISWHFQCAQSSLFLAGINWKEETLI